MKKVLVCILVLVLCLTAFVACDPKEQGPSAEISAAKQTLDVKYKDTEVTPADYEVMSKVVAKGKTYDVEWTIAIVSGAAGSVVIAESATAGMVKVDIVPERPETDIVYDLTARIYGNGEELTVTYRRTVPQWKEFTFAEYVAAEKDSAVVVKGLISGIIAKSKGATNNCLYVNDATEGGYYVYQLTKDPVTELNLAVGMEVRVTGVKDNYNGTLEIKNADVEILNATPVAVEAADFTQKFINAENTKAPELVNPQAQLVTIKGATLTSKGDNGYYNFTLEGKSTYVRISSSTCPLSTEEQTAFEKAFTDHIGYTADITGVICVYGGAFYLTPVDGNVFTNFQLPALDDAGKVAFVKENLTVDTNVTGNFQLPDAGMYDTTIAWAVKEASDYITIAKNDSKHRYDATVTLPTDAEAKVVIVATITSGEVNDTKEFELTIAKEQIVTIAQFLEKEEDSTIYSIIGWIAAANANAGKTGSFVLIDDTGAVFSYNKADVTVGDKVKVTGTRSSNNGVPQIGTANVEKLTAEAHELPAPRTISVSAIDTSTLTKETVGDYCGEYLEITDVTLAIGEFVNGNNGNKQVLSLYMNDAIKAICTDELANSYATVKVYGFCRGFKTDNYLTIQVTKVEGQDALSDADKIAKIKAELDKVAGTHNDNFVLPTTVCGVAVTWASNNAAIAIEGANATVTRGADADVDVTLTATFTVGTEQHYDIVVKVEKVAEVGGDSVTLTKTAEELAAAHSDWTVGGSSVTRLDSVELDSVITLSFAGTPVGSYGLNTGKIYSDGFRIYQNEQPQVTVSAATGYVIVSVKITYTVSNTGVLTLNDANVASDQVVDVNANSIVFSVGNTGTKTNGQVRISAIEVVYAPAA